LALAWRIRSATRAGGQAGLGHQHQVGRIDRRHGTKSRISWYGLFGISDSLTVCVFDITSSV
jgi:hypothetical protein